MSDENETDWESLIALQRLRIEQVRLHLDDLYDSTFDAKRARKWLDEMLLTLAALESMRDQQPPVPDVMH
jgi:hypothetical protein